MMMLWQLKVNPLFTVLIIAVSLWIGSFYYKENKEIIKKFFASVKEIIYNYSAVLGSTLMVIVIIASSYYLLFVAKIKLVGSTPADFALAGTLSNLCITIIPAYAALIVLPLTISVVHYSKIYPLSPLSGFLTKKIINIAIIYFIILLACCIEIILIGGLNRDTPSTVILITLILLFSTLFVPLVPLIRQLTEILAVSPYVILQKNGYPNKLKLLFDKNDYEGMKMMYRQGLALVRSCIVDLALREYNKNTINLFVESIEIIPWFKTNIERNQETLLMDLINSLDEYVIGPLSDTKYLPNPYDLQPLMINITDILYKLESNLRKMDRHNTGYFYKFLEKLSQLVSIYVKAGKWESIGAFYIGIFHNRISDSRSLVDHVIISSMIINLASLSETLLRERVSLEISGYITTILDMAIKRPHVFIGFGDKEVAALRTFINMGDDFISGRLIILLMFAKEEVSKEGNVFSKIRAIQNFRTIKDLVEGKLSRENLGLSMHVETKRLSVIHLAASPSTITGIGLELYADTDLKKIQDFLNSEFKDFLYDLTFSGEPGTYSISIPKRG